MPASEDVEKTVEKAIRDLGDNCGNAEIAFFGGSFTAINRDYMLSLLSSVQKYISRFHGIRISTRPDYIDREILDILKNYGVTSIELGAQSMCDDVLSANMRGHTAAEVISASKLIMEYGFSLGLQMMTGLYKSDFQKDMYTADKFIEIKPDTVRIYPTVILDDTYLGRLYKENKYKTYTLEQSVSLCADLLSAFDEAGITVIRLGLHHSESIDENILYNNYHPAFKELCEGEIFRRKIDSLLKNGEKNKDITLITNPKSKSKLIGQKKCNINHLNSLGYNVTIKENDSLNKYDVIINYGGR